MRNTIADRIRKRLTILPLTPEEAGQIDKQIRDTVALAITTFDTSKPIDDQMRKIARDAYFQGLIDGAQVAGMVPFQDGQKR